jgi:hypothetical protein
MFTKYNFFYVALIVITTLWSGVDLFNLDEIWFPISITVHQNQNLVRNEMKYLPYMALSLGVAMGTENVFRNKRVLDTRVTGLPSIMTNSIQRVQSRKMTVQLEIMKKY